MIKGNDMSKDFKAKIVPDKYVGNLFSITNNGYQWTGLSLYDKEDIDTVICVLSDYYNKLVAQSNEKL